MSKSFNRFSSAVVLCLSASHEAPQNGPSLSMDPQSLFLNGDSLRERTGLGTMPGRSTTIILHGSAGGESNDLN